MEIKIIKDKITLDELKNISAHQFGGLVKFVVDLNKEIMAVGGALQADEEALLLQEGSNQDDLWGINFYPEKQGTDRIAFDSMINLRPVVNRSRDVEDIKTRQEIVSLVNKLVAG